MTVAPRIYLGLTRANPNDFVSREVDRLSGGGGFCHSFLWVSDLAVCWEAHFGRGVRFTARAPSDSELVYQLPDYTEAKATAIFRRMCLLAGAPYDALGAYHSGTGLLSKVFRENPDAYFCSESCLTVLAPEGYFPGVVPGDTSPNELAPLVAGWVLTDPRTVLSYTP